MKKAFITGVSGQDGSYLAELLLEKGYEVHGLLRRNSDFTTSRIDSILNNSDINNSRFFIHYGDMSDSANIYNVLSTVKPDEVYNLAAQSHVGLSYSVPEYSSNIDGIGVLRLLSAMRDIGLNAKFYQASTSELFGGIKGSAPQNENTPFMPRSPYAVAKLYGYWVTKNFRDAYNMYTTNGILFNHESPRRGKTFVTKKITRAVANIVHGKDLVLRLGNLDAKRDWGYAKEYVEAMWLTMQQDNPDDYVVGTGKMYTVRYFAEKTFEAAGFDIVWDGAGDNEKGYDSKTNKLLVMVDPSFYRPLEVEELCADYSKAKKVLNWSPKTDILTLIDMMLQYDIKYDVYGYPDKI